MALVGTASLGGVWALFTQRNAHIRPFATPVFPRLWHSHIKLTSGRPPMHLLFLDVRGHNLFISDHIFFFLFLSSCHFPQHSTQLGQKAKSRRWPKLREKKIVKLNGYTYAFNNLTSF